MKQIKLLMLSGLLTVASCFSGNNPKFNCSGLGCSESSTSGTQPTLAPLSFLETLEQGYWYSRYNLGHVVFKKYFPF